METRKNEEEDRREEERQQIFDTVKYIEEKERWIEGHHEHIATLKENIEFARAKGQPPENGPAKGEIIDDEYMINLRQRAEAVKDTAPWFVWTYAGDVSSTPLDGILFDSCMTRTTEQGFRRATEKGMALARYVAAADPKAVLWLMDEIGRMAKTITEYEETIFDLKLENQEKDQ